MGSKFSRAVRPQVSAVALPVATAQHHDMSHANAAKERQELEPRLSGPYCYDDLNVTTSITPPAITQRRNSAPAIPLAPLAPSVAMNRAPNVTSFSRRASTHVCPTLSYRPGTSACDYPAPTTSSASTAYSAFARTRNTMHYMLHGVTQCQRPKTCERGYKAMQAMQ
jgi:hypothetical protein